MPQPPFDNRPVLSGSNNDQPVVDCCEMIEKCDIWFWIVDTLGNYQWCSAGVSTVIGYSPQEVVGENLMVFLPEREKSRVFGFLEAQSSEFKAYKDFEIVFLSKSGREKYALVSGTPIFSENGEYCGYRGTIRDITEQMEKTWRLEENSRMWERTQREAKIGSWEYNHLTDTVVYSDEMFRIFEVEKPVGPHNNEAFMSRIHPEDKQKVIDADSSLQNKAGSTQLEFRICLPGNEQHPDGREKYCKEFLQSMEDDFGEVVLFTGTLQDITDTVKIHQELNRKIQFEHYLGKIAEQFVRVENPETAIQKVLSYVATLSEADRAYIFEFDWDKDKMSNTHEWCSQGIEPQIHHLQEMPVQVASYWLEKFHNKKCVFIKDTAAIPDERKVEREILQQQDIHSAIACPIHCNGQLWGFFGLDNTRSADRWNQETITLITVFIQIFQNYLEKRMAEDQITKLLNELQIVNNNLEQTVRIRTEELKASLEEVKKTQTHFELALKASDIGIWVWDFENEPVPESFAFSKYFKKVHKGSQKRVDFESSSIVRWEASVHPEHWDYVFNEKVKYLEGLREDYSIDYKIWLDSQMDWRWINSTGVIVSRDKNGSPTLMLGTYKDITARKETELMLKNARASAEMMIKNKSEFLSNLNHELRTPLTIIMGNSESLLYSDVDNELKPFLKTINRAALQLLELIEEIVDISKIDEGKIKAEMKEVKTKRFFASIYEYYKGLADEKGLDFSLKIAPDFPPSIRTDSKLMKKICNNLIGNAIKFTKEGFVTLSLSMDQSRQRCLFKVEDSGIGIPKEKQAMIFERFSQADSSSKRRYGGTGLGLSIAKSAADILKAQIHVQSEVSKGSVFTLSFPRQP